MADAEPLGGDVSAASLFTFEIDGVDLGAFTQLSGLRAEVAVETYVEGGQNGYAHTFPRGMRWPHLVLSRGMVQSDAFFDWMWRSSGEGFATGGNRLVRHTGAVTVYSNDHVRLRAWDVVDAYPVSWTGPDLGVGRRDLLVETLEVAHSGFRAKTL